VRSPRGAEWFVADAVQSGRAMYTVFCVSRRDYREAFGHTPGGMGVLADELLERVRQRVTEERRRFRDRNYNP
jgi:hypothetical protein